jgi:hypothetical protein
LALSARRDNVFQPGCGGAAVVCIVSAVTEIPFVRSDGIAWHAVFDGAAVCVVPIREDRQ